MDDGKLEHSCPKTKGKASKERFSCRVSIFQHSYECSAEDSDRRNSIWARTGEVAVDGRVYRREVFVGGRAHRRKVLVRHRRS